MSAKKLYYPRTYTLWRSADLADLNGHELKQKLLEKMANSEDAQRRFWDRVQIGKKNECWEWTTTLCKNNQCGILNISPRDGLNVRMKCHRISYFLTHGSLPHELEVCHKCDNPPCCNPHHLFLGTHADNMKDCKRKGRTSRGQKHHWHKLTERQVVAIRKEHAEGDTITEIAKDYKMSFYAIWAIVNRRSWKHLK